MEKIKLNFFQQIKNAILKPTEYYRLSKLSGGRTTGFVFLFVFIITLFTIVPMTYDVVGPNGVAKYVNESLPEFKMEDGQLNVAEKFVEDDGNNYILVDTSVEKFTTDDVKDTYKQVILVSKTNLIMFQNSSTREFSFSDLNGLSFDNSIVKAFIPFIYIIFFVAMIFLYLFGVAWYYITVLLYSLVGLIVSSVSNLRIPYKRIFKVAIYSKVTASFITVIINLIGDNTALKPSGLLSLFIAIIVTCTYVVYGTLSHHSEETQTPVTPVPPTNY